MSWSRRIVLGAMLAMALAGAGEAQKPTVSVLVLEVDKASEQEQLFQKAQRYVGDALKMASPEVRKDGDHRVVIRAQALSNRDVDGIADHLARRYEASVNLVDDDADPDSYTAGVVKNGQRILPDDATGSMLVIVDAPLLTGADFETASAAVSEQTRQPIVMFTLTAAGAATFADATERHVGKRFAIVLNGRIISAPRILDRIAGGSGQISGVFSMEEARAIAMQLRASSEPQTSARLIEVRTE